MSLDLTYLAAFGTFFVAAVPVIWALEWFARLAESD